KTTIAKALDVFGVEYIELMSPVASEQLCADCEAICKLGLQAKILTHIRCNMDEARVAVEMVVDGVNVVMGTSFSLHQFSHGKDMAYITCNAIEVVEFVKSKGVETRFSSEDSFRSDLIDLLLIYQTVDKIVVHCVGIADTMGCTTPCQVYALVHTLRGVVGCNIEVHLHNETGMAIANAYTALEGGATHINISILSIGEHNGITPLGGLVACLYAVNSEVIKSKYNLHLLREIKDLIMHTVEVKIPFMNPIIGDSTFAHKAGVYNKFQDVVSDLSTQVFQPGDFGLGLGRTWEIVV
ncbi:HMGL-like-domain-containing protein, partial [Mycena olivaceomarginata]